MACGLREFEAKIFTLPNKFGGIHIGASPIDCGFSGPSRVSPPGGWSYLGPMRHGIRIGNGIASPDFYDSKFKLDGVKLVWP